MKPAPKGIVEFVNPVAKAHINRLEDRIVGRKIEEIFDIYSETDNCKVAVGLPNHGAKINITIRNTMPK